ncbi:MAG: DUF1150 family protein [Dongiaceae bacterium]
MNPTERFRQFSLAELQALGLQGVAYIKPVAIDGAPACAIFAADGTQLAIVPNRDIAVMTLRQNDLEPVSVH